MEKIKYDVVLVKWFDAQHGTHILEANEFQDLQPLFTVSVGCLIEKRKDAILLGFMLFGNKLKHYQLIPRGMIKQIKKLSWIELELKG